MRAVWAVSLVPEFPTFTFLQYCMLLGSVSSFKKYHPEATTILYVSPYYYYKLKLFGVLDFWDEVCRVDFLKTGKITQASWDYAKVKALSLEKEKVLYIDYDIVFWDEIFSNLDFEKQIVYVEEPLSLEGVYLTKKDLRKYNSNLTYGNVAINTGILSLSPEIIESWDSLYSQELPLILAGRRTSSIWNPVCLSVGQGGLGKLLKNVEYQEFVKCVPSSKYTHYLGNIKSGAETLAYRELLYSFTSNFPDIVKLVESVISKKEIL